MATTNPWSEPGAWNRTRSPAKARCRSPWVYLDPSHAPSPRAVRPKFDAQSVHVEVSGSLLVAQGYRYGLNSITYRFSYRSRLNSFSVRSRTAPSVEHQPRSHHRTCLESKPHSRTLLGKRGIADGTTRLNTLFRCFGGAPRCGAKPPAGEEALRAAYTPDNICVVWYDPIHGVRQINVNEVGL